MRFGDALTNCASAPTDATEEFFEYDAEEFLAFLTLLITEGRTPEYSVKGRTEGLHCPPAQSAMPPLHRHECSDKLPQVLFRRPPTQRFPRVHDTMRRLLKRGQRRRAAGSPFLPPSCRLFLFLAPGMQRCKLIADKASLSCFTISSLPFNKHSWNCVQAWMAAQTIPTLSVQVFVDLRIP